MRLHQRFGFRLPAPSVPSPLVTQSLRFVAPAPATKKLRCGFSRLGIHITNPAGGVIATTKQLPREQWSAYFEAFTEKCLRDPHPEEADIRVLSPDLGAQEQVKHVRLQGIAYDRKDNVLEIMLHRLDHLIFNPKEIWVVEEENGFLSSMEIVRSDDTREIVEFKSVGIAPASE